MRKIAQIIVHCSDTTSGTTEAIRAYHMKPVSEGGRGFSDIGYHFVIERDGSLHPGRPESLAGAHCEGQNADSIGVCMVGTYEFTTPQLATMRTLIRLKMKEFNLTNADVHGHYEMPTGKAQGKTCPNIPGSVVRFILEEEE